MSLLGNSTSMLGVALFGVIVLCANLNMLIFWKAGPVKNEMVMNTDSTLKVLSGIVNSCSFRKYMQNSVINHRRLMEAVCGIS